MFKIVSSKHDLGDELAKEKQIGEEEHTIHETTAS